MCSYDSKREILYIYDEIYQTQLSNRRAYELIMGKIHNPKAVIYADSAEPKSIAELKGYGLEVKPVRKGPDSVDYGISWLQHLEKIYIDKIRCPNAYTEFISYEYEKDKYGNYISSYPDKNNHCLTGDTIVNTPKGDFCIEQLVGTEGAVYCYDETSKELTVSTYKDCRLTQKQADVYEIELVDGRVIHATAEHLIFTQRGWIKVADLNEDDSVLSMEVGNEAKVSIL